MEMFEMIMVGCEEVFIAESIVREGIWENFSEEDEFSDMWGE